MKPSLLTANLMLVAALAIGYLIFEQMGDGPGASSGKQAPDFELPIVQGEIGPKVSRRQFAGQPLILNFWASWCGACASERRQLEVLKSRTDAAILGVATSDMESSVREAEQRAPHPYPVAFDAGGVVANTYEVTGLPVTLVVGPDGTVLRRIGRALRDRDVDDLVKSLRPLTRVAVTGGKAEAAP